MEHNRNEQQHSPMLTVLTRLACACDGGFKLGAWGATAAAIQRLLECCHWHRWEPNTLCFSRRPQTSNFIKWILSYWTFLHLIQMKAFRPDATSFLKVSLLEMLESINKDFLLLCESDRLIKKIRLDS